MLTNCLSNRKFLVWTPERTARLKDDNWCNFPAMFAGNRMACNCRRRMKTSNYLASSVVILKAIWQADCNCIGAA